MTDQELLEKAAKAAGYTEFDWLSSDNIMNVYDDEGYQYTFDPLEDDGDALRLAVKLGLLNLDDCLFYHGKDIDFQDDPLAATRRAIVRAAAEMGEQK